MFITVAVPLVFVVVNVLIVVVVVVIELLILTVLVSRNEINFPLTRSGFVVMAFVGGVDAE